MLKLHFVVPSYTVVEVHDATQVLLGKALQAAWVRNEALTANIANVETPGYQRVDVSFHDALADAMKKGKHALAALEFEPRAEPGGAVQANGNNVTSEVESAELASNGLFYQTLLSVKQARGSIFKYAAGVK